jgi:outer membrane protein assembly factor BamB
MTTMSSRMSLSRRLSFMASAAVLTLAIVSISSNTSSAVTSFGSSWTVYHGDPAGSGLSLALSSVDTHAPKWTSPALDGALYGEPLVFGDAVFVATESDTVYALSATTGRVEWRRHVASAVPASALPCGDITPTVGITGTPVIDAARSEIFVVADEMVHGHPAHVLWGLNTANGAIELSKNVDPPGSYPPADLQRTGLTLDNGHVIFGFGGNWGDCSTYRGRVGSESETGGRPSFFTVDNFSGDSQGAIWMGGAAPTVNAQGDIWVSAGNGSVHSSGQRFDDSDSVLDLTSTLRLRQYFAPSSWPQDNASDLDFSMAPVLLSSGEVVISGKSQFIDLLNAHHLGGIGHQQRSITSDCGNDVDGGAAVLGNLVYLPCLSGPLAVRASTSPFALLVLWHSNVGGGPPIIAAGLVWTIGQNGVLYGLNHSTGAVVQQATIGAPDNHFPTPSIGDGLLLAPSSNRVVAFRGVAS